MTLERKLYPKRIIIVSFEKNVTNCCPCVHTIFVVGVAGN